MSATATSIDNLIQEVAGKVITQPLEQVADCVYFALQNLYVRCNLEPPTIQRMKDVVVSPDPFIGIGPVQQMTMLTEMAFPGIVALAIIPHGSTARDVFPALMASGWRLLISYTFTAQITREGALSVVGDADFAGMTMFAGHALVPFESDDEGLFVVVGWPETPVEKISWKTMPSMAWNLDGQPQGIAREFVMVRAYGN